MRGTMAKTRLVSGLKRAGILVCEATKMVLNAVTLGVLTDMERKRDDLSHTTIEQAYLPRYRRRVRATHERT